ncbi:hypothetical protein BU14_2575s0001, partial [Porphyra umbilicalis]
MVTLAFAALGPGGGGGGVRAAAAVCLGRFCLADNAGKAPAARGVAGDEADAHAPPSQGAAPVAAPTADGVGGVGRVGGVFADTLTRSVVPALVRELDADVAGGDGGGGGGGGGSGDVPTRINAILALCDVCRRSTAVVEPHALRLGRCLTDPSPAVRATVLASLAALLSEDYLKWRGGPLLFRLLLALLDPVAGVAGMATYALESVLAPKGPAVFTLHFVEALFFFNAASSAGADAAAAA